MALRIDKAILLWGTSITLLMFFPLAPDHALSFEKRFENSVGMEFVLIPAGTFVMGSPPDEPHRDKNEDQHRVTITKPFYLQTTEVTLKQWRAIMGKRLFGRRKGSEEMPIVKVSWFDSIEFIKKLNALNDRFYRVPREAEWEYGARAGSTEAYSWGKEIQCPRAMYSNNRLKSKECIDYVKSRGFPVDSPAPVKSYSPNAWGLYDMHGNVWEWCQDWYGPYPKGPVTDPKGPDSGKKRVRRGGSWFKHGWSTRSANRNNGHPGTKHNTLGFRVLMEIPK